MNNEENKVVIYKPDLTLKNKVGEGGINRLNNKRVIEETQKIMVSSGLTILNDIATELSNMEHYIKIIKQEQNFNEVAVNELINSAFFIKSNGGFCNYPLITLLGRSLYLYCETCKKNHQIGTKEIEIIDWHIESVKFILKEEITDTGGDFGKELKKQLAKFHNLFVDKFVES